jgi:hypothetical protein
MRLHEVQLPAKIETERKCWREGLGEWIAPLVVGARLRLEVAGFVIRNEQDFPAPIDEHCRGAVCYGHESGNALAPRRRGETCDQPALQRAYIELRHRRAGERRHVRFDAMLDHS